MRTRKIGEAIMLLTLGLTTPQAMAQRIETELRTGWSFTRDGEHWEQVTLPHDWAIAGPFDKKWDLQTVAIEQNGETEATEKSGRSGALPWIGEGEYKCSIYIDADAECTSLLFDGAMSEPIVYVNGKEAGRWGYGYNAFEIDITDLVKKGAENSVNVKLNNREESSRWYPGAGIYRPVTLISRKKLHLDDWSTFLRTQKIATDEATLVVSAKLVGLTDDSDASVTLELTDAKGQKVAEWEANDVENIWGRISVKKPHVWSPEDPYLYTAKITVKDNGKVTDEKSFKTGIRTVRVSKENGFELNGKSRKIQGVCLHHDLGPLGAAVNRAAIERQIRIMKDMGADAIRTAHNMPSDLQMQICDSMGMMVMAESFDMWVYPKCQNGYARIFKEWSDRDIENLVRRHRNHPSIVMWSIGNEIPEQGMGSGPAILTRLQDICHRLDETRPVTQGMDRIDNALKTGFAQLNDVPGMNYRVHKYASSIGKLPQGFLLGSETASTVSSRGAYKFPVEVSNQKTYADGQCSSYDTEYCSWSNLPEDDFEAMDDLDYTIGQFVWTGFDYLGEPTPYDTYWPSRSSYFGICDLAGLAKDRYYLYRSQWRKDEHTIHLLPHWTWTGREGEVTPVYCYTDYPEAELFVNGKSQGRIKKNKESKMDRYRLRWNDVKYEPGELRVVTYDAAGNKSGEQVIRTAGKASKLTLDADRTTLRADGEDIAFVTVTMKDKDGNLVPDAANQLIFSVEGDGKFQAACNGDATSLEPFTEPTMKLFNGQLVVLVRSTEKAGSIRLTVTDKQNNISQQVDIRTK